MVTLFHVSSKHIYSGPICRDVACIKYTAVCIYASHNKKYHEAAMRLYVKLKLYLNDAYYVKRLPHLTCIKRL